MYTGVLPKQTVFAYLIHLSQQGKYLHTSHSNVNQGKRKLSDAQIIDIMSNPIRIIRSDPASKNRNGLPSYKVEGGSEKHRIAFHFIDIADNGELTEDSYIHIITVMNYEN